MSTQAELARENMVENQIRTWEVLDQAVLDAMQDVPREDFVPEGYRQLAYADTEIPLGGGEVMMAPKLEARMMQALQLDPRDSVLEIGTGSGYVTAVLARLARHVASIEVREDLCERARARLSERAISNVTVDCGDGLQGRPKGAPYDAIAVTGSVYEVPQALLTQLRIGGRLFAIVGEAPAMEALLITRTGPDQWSTESLFETVLAPLKGAEKPSEFSL